MICCSSLDSEFELLDGITPLTIDDLVFSPNYTRFNQDDQRWDWCLFVSTKMIHDQLESFILQKMQTGSKDKKHKSKERSYSHKKRQKSFATNINFQRGGGRSQLWPHGKWSPLFCCSEYHWQVISSWFWIVISLLWWHCRKGLKCHKMLGKICIDVHLCIVHCACGRKRRRSAKMVVTPARRRWNRAVKLVSIFSRLSNVHNAHCTCLRSVQSAGFIWW